MKFYRIKISNQPDGKLIHNFPPPKKGGMDLYFSRLFLRDQYSVALDKFGQKQLENAGLSGVKVKIKSEITPDNAEPSRRVVVKVVLFFPSFCHK